MEEDDQPSFTIKKRTKSRPSGAAGGSLSRSASSASLNSPAKLSFGGDEENEEGAGNVAVIRSRGKKTPAGRVREREGGGAAGGKSKSRLSFGASGAEEEEEDDSVVVKRSTPSSTPRRLLRPTLPTSASSSLLAGDAAGVAASPVANVSSGTYSRDYLESLKAEQRSTPRSAAASTAEAGEGDGYDSLTRSKFGNEQLQDDTSIPTSDAISRAKARREEMRKSGATAPPAGSDYVSLDVGFANKGGDSRLVREEDELGDGDEDLAAYTDSLTSLPLGKKANKAAALKLRQEMGEMIDDVAMDVEEEDEEMREWEAAQVRRAGGGDERRSRREPADGGKGGKKPYRAAPIPHSAPIPTLTAVLSRLTTSLSTLQATHTADASALLHFAREREDLDRQERELREEVEKVEKKSLWFEEMKGEVEDWSAFLEEKFPALESIESESLALLRERYLIITSRRFKDASDDVALFTGQPVPLRFPPKLLPSDGDERMDEDATDDADSEESPEDLEPRSAARTARRAEREQRLSSSSSPDAAEDSLPPSSASDLRAALTDQHTTLTSLFADVRAPAFRDPNLGIRQKFEEWRSMWKEEYEMTFAGLGMVQVWEFWARVEVVGGWNPLEIEELPKSPADLSSYAWHQALSSYGHSSSPSGEDEDLDQADESTELINSLVASVLIPRLSAIARAGYDPYSERQTRAAIKWVDEVSYCVEPSSPKFESLVTSFLLRLRLSIAHLQTLLLPYLSSLTLPSLAYDPTNFTARHRFLASSLPLLRSAQKWRRYMRALRISAVPTQLSEEDGGGVLEVGAGATFDELVQRELVARTLLPVVEAAWSTGGEEVAKKILETLPKDIPPALRRRLEGEEAAR
ncbi:hypothetical protein JCM6882_005881 [Rhodosporidiobolus microsporus]